MNIAIVQFPGSNCERETMLAVKRAGMQPEAFLWNEPVDKLAEMDGFVIVGGFSYEDRSRAGIIAALDPVMQQIKIQAELGKPVLGICNGAQILVETGLVPGVENNKVVMALTENKRIVNNKILGTGYYNAWVNIRLTDNYQRNAFTGAIKASDVLSVPLANGEGRFVIPEALLLEMQAQGLGLFQYCDASGEIDEHFPVNPNASVNNIAAVTNKAGNVMAMMPHPERSETGDVIFQSMRLYIEKQKTKGWQPLPVTPLYYYPRRFDLQLYQKQPHVAECIAELLITDNHALTVQQTLQKLGMPVKVKRYVHWEIDTQSPEMISKISESDVLFNPRKERAVLLEDLKQKRVSGKSHCRLLVKPKDDVLGFDKWQLLVNHFQVEQVKAINHGIVWEFESEDLNEKDLLDGIINSHIIFNESAHDCYQYDTATQQHYSAIAG